VVQAKNELRRKGHPPNRADTLAESIIQHRRALHAIPELGFDLPRTTAYLEKALAEMGLEAKRMADGLVVDLGQQGPLFAWRADMDALPIQEVTGAEYASTHPGQMHACGHDAHMAIALGIARHFSTEGNLLPCRLRLIFQPGEEVATGAKRMIAGGALKGVQAIAGLHVWNSGSPAVPNAVFGSRVGAIMAACEFFEIHFKGLQTHGAFPNLGNDALLAACQCVSGLQTARYSAVDPTHAAVISVGMIHAGAAPNILPDRSVFQGSVRTVDSGDREKIEQKVRRLAEGVGLATGTDVTVVWNRMIQATVNDRTMVLLVEAAIRKALGEGAFVLLDQPTLGSEDFGEYLEHVPGVFLFLGTSNARRGIMMPLHHPAFELDEWVLPRAIPVVDELLRRWARNQPVDGR
jgi:amidohydrolase